MHVSLIFYLRCCTLIEQEVILNSSISFSLTVGGLVCGKNNMQNKENVKG